jgi:hypothetical protein
MAQAAATSKGKTAYFVFCELHRSSVREELLAGKDEGAKVRANVHVSALLKKSRAQQSREQGSQASTVHIRCACAKVVAGTFRRMILHVLRTCDSDQTCN